jgi:hypothetical protein
MTAMTHALRGDYGQVVYNGMVIDEKWCMVLPTVHRHTAELAIGYKWLRSWS